MKFVKVIERLSEAGGMISGLCILLMSGLILLEILVRSVTRASILIAEEYSAYLLVVFGSMALAYTFKSEGHIRVDLILSKLSPRGRSLVNFFCSLIGFLVFLLVSYQTWGQFSGSWTSRETSMYYSKTPLWLPQVFLFLGPLLMALQMLSSVIVQYRSLKRRGEEGSGR